jgi:transposase InsO family protein
LTGKFNACADCAIGKARQKNLNKLWTNGSKVPGERLYVDISSIRGESYGGAKYWALVVDDCTDFCWSFFLKAKSDLKKKIVDLIKELKSANHVVAFVRLDDAGENKSLEKMCKQEGLGIQFEYTGARTPQRNGRVEQKFQTLYGRVRAMLNGADIRDEV